MTDLKFLDEKEIKKLKKYYGGQQIYVPKENDRDEKKKQIRDEFIAMSTHTKDNKTAIIATLSAKYDKSTRTINRIIKGI